MRYTYDSNRIEGNTLTLQETALVLEKDVTIAGKSLREHLEVTNHAHAFDYIKDVAAGDIDFTPLVLRHIHHLILSSILPAQAGVYRTVDVAIVGSTHNPPSHYQIAEQMEAYFAWHEAVKGTLPPVLLAADLHDRLVTIHPFIDGNGRTARLVMNLTLLRHGYPIAIISGDAVSRIDYYAALEASQVGGDPALFRTLVARTVKQSAFWYLERVATTDDPRKGAYFFQQIGPLLDADATTREL